MTLNSVCPANKEDGARNGALMEGLCMSQFTILTTTPERAEKACVYIGLLPIYYQRRRKEKQNINQGCSFSKYTGCLAAFLNQG